MRLSLRQSGRRTIVAAALAAATFITTSPVIRWGTSPAKAESAGSYTNPVYEGTAGDPAVLRVGGTFYAYTTQTAADGSGPHIPLLSSTNLTGWTFMKDALPELPEWALDGPNRDTWAPHVVRYNGRYLMYFSARRNTGNMAIGLAVSERADGPFQPVGEPIVSGDAIDPFIMKTREGLYMYWMVPREPIRVQKLSADGTQLIGDRRTVLRPAPDREYERLIEGPWVVKRGDYYYLFYSGNHCCAPNPHYALMVARSRYPRRGFTRHPNNPILEANSAFIAPGHNSVLKDDEGKHWTLYHAIRRGDENAQRVMMLDRIRWFAGWPRINGGDGPSSTSKTAPTVRLLP